MTTTPTVHERIKELTAMVADLPQDWIRPGAIERIQVSNEMDDDPYGALYTRPAFGCTRTWTVAAPTDASVNRVNQLSTIIAAADGSAIDRRSLEDLVRAAQKNLAREVQAEAKGRPMLNAMSAIHDSRKRHPIEWPEIKP